MFEADHLYKLLPISFIGLSNSCHHKCDGWLNILTSTLASTRAFFVTFNRVSDNGCACSEFNVAAANATASNLQREASTISKTFTRYAFDCITRRYVTSSIWKEVLQWHWHCWICCFAIVINGFTQESSCLCHDFSHILLCFSVFLLLLIVYLSILGKRSHHTG